jgi:hypothetical protein
MRILGIYQIAGGVMGLTLTGILLGNQTSLQGLVLLIIFFAIALYIYSAFCGIQLIRKRQNGLLHSSINQYLQLISFSFLGYTYQYFSGCYFTIGIDLTNSFLISFGVGVSSWQLNINMGTQDFVLKLNLVALASILIIQKLKRYLKDQVIELSIQNIGQQHST